MEYRLRKIEQDFCFIFQHIDNKAQVYSTKTGDDLHFFFFFFLKKFVTFHLVRTCMNEEGDGFVQV